MNETVVGVIALCLLLGLFLTGIELAFAMGIIGVAGFAYLAGDSLHHAFLWRKLTGLQDLGTLGGNNSKALGIDIHNRVVGWAQISGDAAQHAFLWTHVRGMQDLGTLGGNNSEAFGVIFPLGEEFEWVVGQSDLPNSSTTHAFLWTDLFGMQDLNALIPPASGWELYSATAISRTEEIVGYGSINGAVHAFLLTLKQARPSVTSTRK